jgi:hypothetical protein
LHVNSSTQIRQTFDQLVLPAWQIEQDNDDPYYIDAIQKYFERPRTPLFDNLTYPEYWSAYKIATTQPTPNRVRWIDLQRWIIVKRQKPILLRYKHVRVQDAEHYYYRHLLLLRPWRSEEELKGNHISYREHHAALFPVEHEQASALAGQHSQFMRSFYLDEYQRIVQHLVQTTARPVQEVINDQLSALQRFPIAIPRYSDSFLSDLFGRLHSVHRQFGKVNVILVGDLFQLPPVSGSLVFNSPIWNLFYPLLI